MMLKIIKIILISFLSSALSFSVAAQSAVPEQIALWKNGAQGFENRKDEPEEAKDWEVKNNL